MKRFGCFIALLLVVCHLEGAEDSNLRLTRIANGVERSLVIEGTPRGRARQHYSWMTAAQAPDGTIVVLERSVLRRISRNGNLLGSVTVEDCESQFIILPDNSVVVRRMGKAPKIFGGILLEEDLTFTRNASDAISALGIGRSRFAMGQIASSPDGTIVLTVEIERDVNPPEPHIHTSHIGVAKLRRDGTIERRFGRNGFAGIQLPGVSIANVLMPTWMYIGVSPDGEITCTYRDSQEYAIRWTADGKLDPRFGWNGRIRLVEGPNNMAIDSKGGVILVYSDYLGIASFVVRRLRNDGSDDPSFGVYGFANLHLRDAKNRGVADSRDDHATGAPRIDFDSAGRIVLGGEMFHFAVPCAAVARLLPDGAIDESFGPEGFRFTRVDGNSTEIAVVAGTDDDETFIISRN